MSFLYAASPPGISQSAANLAYAPLANAPVWSKYTVGFAALQVAGLTNAVTVLTLPAKGIVHAAVLNVTQAFAGPTTVTLSLGVGGSVAKYVVATSVLATGLIVGVTPFSPSPESMSSTTAVLLSAISTVLNLSALSQGSVDVYVLASQLP